MRYYETRRERLGRFLVDANVPLDNNTAERCQRMPVMGRNNFQGFRTINGADIGMTFYTIVATCKMMGITPRDYKLVMATRSANGEDVVTPHAWAHELTMRARTKIGCLEVMAGLG